MVDFSTALGNDLDALLRAAAWQGPTTADEASGATVVLRYADIEALARDHRLAGVGLAFFDSMRITHPLLLSFGAGPHYCLGAALARMTVEEAARATFATDLDLVDDAPPWRVVLGRSPAQLLVEA